MLAGGTAPKTVRIVMSFAHAMFALAIRSEWITSNPVDDAARPMQRRKGDANPDVQFSRWRSSVRSSRRSRTWSSTATRGGPVLRVLILMAAGAQLCTGCVGPRLAPTPSMTSGPPRAACAAVV
jgi:hypothetical protein